MKWQGPKLCDDWEKYCKPPWMSEVQICRIRDNESKLHQYLIDERERSSFINEINLLFCKFFTPIIAESETGIFCCSEFFLSWTLCGVFWEEVGEIAYFIASLVQSYESTVVGQWSLLTSFSALSFLPILMYFCSLFVEEYVVWPQGLFFFSISVFFFVCV